MSMNKEPNRQASAAERARELLAMPGLTRGPLRPIAYSYESTYIDASSAGVLYGDAQVASFPAHPADREVIANDREKRTIREPRTIGEANALLFAEAPRLLADLAAENEALKKELAALRLDHGLLEIHRKQTADQLLACERALQERERDLTTSRAATDKTRKEADAMLSWVGLARPVVEAVRRYREDEKTCMVTLCGHEEQILALPLPPQET